jgi:general secretion pathway protein D
VVATLAEGSILQASAVVSPDRRYVRLAVNPVFTTLTDVFTFSFVSGFDPFGGRNTGINGVGGN